MGSGGHAGTGILGGTLTGQRSPRGTLTLAARGSPLSRVQALAAAEAIERACPGVRTREQWITTEGDRSTKEGFTGIPLPGVFEREVDLAVEEGRADVAVHSLKDIPTDFPASLALAACLPRGPPGDILVGGKGRPPPLDRLPAGFRVGTSSVRRRALMLFHAPEVVVLSVRGNVGTRIQKLGRGEYDALVMAEAGVRRLSLTVPSRPLPVAGFPPAPGQGIIALVTRADGSPDLSAVREGSGGAWDELLAERAFLQRIGGGCSKAIGGHMDAKRGRFHAAEWKEDGSARRGIALERRQETPEELGVLAAERLEEEEWRPRK